MPSVPEFEDAVPAPPLLFLPRTGVLAALVAATLVLLAVAVLLAVLGLLRGVRPERLREGPT
jgi:hypothetical protein